jgi:hypothetical protein
VWNYYLGSHIHINNVSSLCIRKQPLSIQLRSPKVVNFHSDKNNQCQPIYPYINNTFPFKTNCFCTPTILVPILINRCDVIILKKIPYFPVTCIVMKSIVHNSSRKPISGLVRVLYNTISPRNESLS